MLKGIENNQCMDRDRSELGNQSNYCESFLYRSFLAFELVTSYQCVPASILLPLFTFDNPRFIYLVFENSLTQDATEILTTVY
jgi:hypothetical protein